MPTGRYAPSPTGPLHLGNLRTAVAAWLFARSSGSDLLLRFEDLDESARPEHETGQLTDLATLGIGFDGESVRQSERRSHYEDALADLEQADLTYRCWCSRREIREAPSAPHQPRGAYPGTCRDLTAAARREKERAGRPPAIRLRADGARRVVVDRLHGRYESVVDDFVLRRGDDTPAFHLAVVVDDHAQGVQEVVRGDDLLESTPRHAHLQSVLGLDEPAWVHVPLVVDATGARLAKRDGSDSLGWWVASGGTIPGLISWFGRSLGVEAPTDCRLADLLAGFQPERIPLGPAAAPSP